mmetsp:Transcript_20859/g.63337  ORF Transcript_20859/g.63337 Transcript_20859/m.63337 type:complete len:262 (-) Transcript_20859:900-1685(-)
MPPYPFSAAISSADRPARPLASGWDLAVSSRFRQPSAPFSAAWLSIIGSRTFEGVCARSACRLRQWSKQQADMLAMRTLPRSPPSARARRTAPTSSLATALSSCVAQASRSKTSSLPFQTCPSTGTLKRRTSGQTCGGMATAGVKFTVSRMWWLSQKSQQKCAQRLARSVSSGVPLVNLSRPVFLKVTDSTTLLRDMARAKERKPWRFSPRRSSSTSASRSSRILSSTTGGAAPRLRRMRLSRCAARSPSCVSEPKDIMLE